MYECNLLNIRILCLLQGLNQQITAAGTIMIFAADQADIPCITVTGKLGGENHMWNLARIDGQWLYFDPTSDRGRVDYGFQYFGVGEDALLRYTWDREGTRSLTEALFP